MRSGNKGGNQRETKAAVGTTGVRKDGIYEVVWPCGERVGKVTPLSKRLDTLKGKTICELWDYLFEGDKISKVLEEELSKRFPGIKFVGHQAFGSTHGGDERKTVTALPSLLVKNKCDAVISSVGC